jgi:hypothetical protein
VSNETKFGAVVEINDAGLIVNVWSYEDKYKARDAAHDKAKESPGTLFVVMDTDEAYRAEPVVRTVYLSFPARPAKTVAPSTDPAFDEI